MEVRIPTKQYNCVYLDELTDENNLFELRSSSKHIKSISKLYQGDTNCDTHLNNTIALVGP